MPNTVILGCGKGMGQIKMTNKRVIEKITEAGGEATTEEWIVERTGIQKRCFAKPKETSASMAVKAAKNALRNADISISEIEAIIVATCTSDYGGTPSTACIVQKALCAKDIPAFDINAACCGFIYALAVADSLVKTTYKNILLVGSETLSRFIDWQDRSTAPLLGDGAGSFILSRSNNEWFGIIDWEIHAQGDAKLLIIPGGGSKFPATADTVSSRWHYLKMQGKEVFKFAVIKAVETIMLLLKRNHLLKNEIDLIFLHQANFRITNAVSEKLKIPREKFFDTVASCGNTSAASIPIGLDIANKKNLLYKGSKILLIGFGGGLTWGGCYLIWGN